MENIKINFNDLPDDVQEKVREFYCDDYTLVERFTEDCEMWLEENFKQSELEVQYSLCYCQGDGFTIYGTLYYSDIVDKIDYAAYGFTAKEEKFIKWAVKEGYGYSVQIPVDYHGNYFPSSLVDFGYNIENDLEYNNIRGIKYAALEKFDRACCDYFEELCAKFAADGYEYFYEPSTDELQYLFDEYFAEEYAERLEA